MDAERDAPQHLGAAVPLVQVDGLQHVFGPRLLPRSDGLPQYGGVE
jgi:hypothetical protein